MQSLIERSITKKKKNEILEEKLRELEREMNQNLSTSLSNNPVTNTETSIVDNLFLITKTSKYFVSIFIKKKIKYFS